jgi:general secretion pathway protein J
MRARRLRAVSLPALGFTLIEVLVSLFILALLASAAWKGVDAISTARQVADDNLQATLRLQSVMTQLDADMSQVYDTQVVRGFQFDGANLRFTRRAAGGVQVVAWSVRERKLLRWASPETSRVGELQDHWRRANQLQGREPGTLVALTGVDRWQVFCFRSGSLSNCQSSGNLVAGGGGSSGSSGSSGASGSPGDPGGGGGTAGAAGAPAANFVREQLPQAIRSQITLGDGASVAGVLSRDIILSPQP